ncbi:MAG: L,D-transpeptidase, partial [Anaerovibrio sp.]
MAFRMKTLAGMICAATMFTFGTAWAAEPEGIDINIADVTREQAAAVASAQVELHEEELIPKVNDGTKIMINLANRGLYLFEKGVKTKLYPIACGRYTNRSPVGYYKVNEKEVNPTWVDPADRSNVVTSGPSNPLGYRWIGFNGYYGIHG